jgi:hypothetical protein
MLRSKFITLMCGTVYIRSLKSTFAGSFIFEWMIPATDEILIWTRRTNNHYHCWKEHLQMSNIAKFGCELL